MINIEEKVTEFAHELDSFHTKPQELLENLCHEHFNLLMQYNENRNLEIYIHAHTQMIVTTGLTHVRVIHSYIRKNTNKNKIMV